MSSSVEVLRRAANRVDSRAAAMRGERWDYDKFEEDGPWVVLQDLEFDGDDVPTVATLGPDCADRDRGGWIALMSPHVAGPLADLLNAIADDAERVAAHGAQRDEVGVATALASLLLGERRP